MEASHTLGNTSQAKLASYLQSFGFLLHYAAQRNILELSHIFQRGTDMKLVIRNTLKVLAVLPENTPSHWMPCPCYWQTFIPTPIPPRSIIYAMNMVIRHGALFSSNA